MKYRDFDGLDISEVGMGCYALSGAYGSVDESHFRKVLKHAYELGINFFDTAQTYGKRAEQILGDVIQPFREEVHVSTKVGIKEGVKPNLSYEYVTSACEESLEHLQTNYIDFYFVHFADPSTPVEETITALEDLQDDGEILHYGVSHLSKQQLREYLSVGNISIGLLELSPVTRAAREDILPLYRKHGVGAVAFSVTGRGLLTGKFEQGAFQQGDIRNIDPLFQHHRLESGLRIAEKLREIGNEYDKTAVQVAIQWVLSQPGILCALTGTSSRNHLEENVGGSGWDLTEQDRQNIEAFLRHEDEFLAEKEPETIKHILKDDLADQKGESVKDLIYAAEVSILHDMTTENAILPTFQQLMTLRKSGDLSSSKLQEIQAKLRHTILP